ncbi:MAG: DUF748 domain-containing protein [Betaproteobacteria bacterium]|nr:DUF748 domain-containing protein [Betaproteobacteria bacterium]
MEPKAPKKAFRWLYCLAALALLLVVSGFAALQYASHLLKNEIAAALGGKGEIEALAVGWGSVEISGIRLPGTKGWPAEEQLRAKRITITPSVPDLVRAKLRIKSIRIEEAYLSVFRDQKGKIHILPDLTEGRDGTGNGKKKGNSDTNIEVIIDAIELSVGSIDFYDASVRRPALKIQMDNIHARVANLRFPNLEGMSDLLFDGIILGKQHNGKARIEGKVEFASMESDLQVKLASVDLTTLETYLIRSANTSIKRGNLTLNLHSVIRQGRLNAPGTLTLSQLEISGKNPLFGVAQDVALAAIKDGKGEISAQFVLDGDINSPNFSLNERIIYRMGNALTEKLGGGLKNTGQIVGNLGKRGKDILKGLGKDGKK